MDLIDRNIHGTRETGGLVDGPAYHKDFATRSAGSVQWTDPRLARVTRLRLVSDPGFPFWDVSYCHGILHDGRPCRVDLPFNQLPRKGLRRAIVEHARRDKVYAIGLGIFDNISTLC